MNSAVQNNIVVLNRDRQQRAEALAASSEKMPCTASRGSTQRVIRAGKTACAAGEKFEGVYIVRSGFFKSYTIDDDGTMQVTGFYLPGECFGMDGIENGAHSEYVEALDTSSVCRISAEAFSNETLAADGGGGFSPQLMLSLMKLMSSTMGRDHKWFFNLGKMNARQRFGNFLLDLAERMAQSGYSEQEFRLCMSRTDIANYLCLALETVSRLFTQLHVEGVIEINRRHVKIIKKHALAAAEKIPESPRAGVHYGFKASTFSSRVPERATRAFAPSLSGHP